jgi:hypothetical protein
MARLNKAQWADVRAAWESDPRESLSWLIFEMRLPVSHEAVRKRAKQEGWVKTENLKVIVEKAQRKADSRELEKVGKVGKVGRKVGKKLDDPTLPMALATGEERADLLADTIETHRKEWQEHRAAFALSSMTEGDEAWNKARCAKTAAEAIRIRQEGERKAWGLDAIETDLNSGVKSEAELKAMLDEGLRKSAEMDEEVRKRRQRMDALDERR